MDKTLDTFNEAQDRVKIGWFTKQGYDITGLVHIGANDGYEIEYYLKMGIAPIVAIEPLNTARKILFNRYFGNPNVSIVSCAIGNFDGVADLSIADGDGKGSSFLRERNGPRVVMLQPTEMHRWASLSRQDIDRSQYNCCVIDVQGMELDVLRGMDDQIKHFDFLSVECSEVPIYLGEPSALEVITFLDRMGFDRDSPIAAHDDIMFINRRVKNSAALPAPIPQGSKLNIGSGQRRFDVSQGWVNVDCVSRPGQVPDLLLDVGKDPLPYDDNSIDVAVLHQVYEHFGLGEGHAMVREIQRVLKPGGSLIVTVPNMVELCRRWAEDETFAEYLFMVNVYGAYQGEPGDRHKWGYSGIGLISDLDRASHWKSVRTFDWRAIAGADIAQDWWILGVECIK